MEYKDKRLNFEEMHYHLLKWRIEKDVDSLRALFDSNAALVKYFAGIYQRSGVEFDDLLSIAREGLLKGINQFDYENNVIQCLPSYISNSIDNTIKEELRKYRKYKDDISINLPVKSIEGEDITIMDTLESNFPDIDSNIINNARVMAFCKLLECLNPKEKEVILLRYGFTTEECYTLQEVADRLGCTHQNVGLIEHKALVKLRKPNNRKIVEDFYN